jgi:fibronectin-binding autotransporter adhesin
MISRQFLQRIFFIFFLLSLWLIPKVALAQTLYWDNVFAGSPDGSWDTINPFWNTNSAGVPNGSLSTWVQGSSAVFSASNLGATGSFNVALSQNLTVANLTYTGGNGGSRLFIAAGGGNTINMANTQMVVAVDPGTTLFLEPVIADPIVDSAGTLTLQSGNLILTGANTYSGGTVITGGGTVTVGNDGGLGAAAGGITLSNGELLTTTGFSSARAINLGFGVGENINTLAAFTGTTVTYTGVISAGGP